MAAIDLKMPDGTAIAGEHPVIVVGANGSGKTTLGKDIAALSAPATRISALRLLLPSPTIPMQPFEQAKQQNDQSTAQLLQQIREYVSDVDGAFQLIYAEHQEVAAKWLKTSRTGGGAVPPPTSKDRVELAWNGLFPSLRVSLDSYTPTAIPTQGGPPYSIRQMSEGEKAALYLLTRVLAATPGVVIIDEPEKHFHPSLAIRVARTLERERPDCRFVYITHDTRFAVARRDSQFIVTRSNKPPEALPKTAQIPADVLSDLVSAATVTAEVSRLIFCEGLRDSLDARLYSSYYEADDTVVVPVGGCESVRQYVEVVRSGQAIRNATALGIIDRDERAEEQLKALEASGVHVLNVFEVEALFCLDEVARAISDHLGHADFDTRRSQYQAAAGHSARQELTTSVLERAKRRTEYLFLNHLNSSKRRADLPETRATFVAAIESTGWPFNVGDVFDEATRIVSGALGNWSDVLKLIPSKIYINDVARALGFSGPSPYADLIVNVLGSTDASMRGLRGKLRSALAPYLPR